VDKRGQTPVKKSKHKNGDRPRVSDWKGAEGKQKEAAQKLIGCKCKYQFWKINDIWANVFGLPLFGQSDSGALESATCVSRLRPEKKYINSKV